jgi:hypothetical protein
MNAPEAACQQPHRICLAVAEPPIAKPVCFPVAVRDVHDGAPPEVARWSPARADASTGG